MSQLQRCIKHNGTGIENGCNHGDILLHMANHLFFKVRISTNNSNSSLAHFVGWLPSITSRGFPVETTWKRRFYLVSTWNSRDVFVGLSYTLQTLANQWLPNYQINIIFSNKLSFFFQHLPLDTLWSRLH